MKLCALSLRTFLPAVLVLCLSELSAESKNDTCGLKIIENALKTSQIKADESAHFHSFRKWLIEIGKPCSTIVKDLK